MKRAGALVCLVFLLGQAAVAQWSRVDPCIRGRVYHAMTYDSARQVAVLFGGIGGGRETWEWDGNGWALASMSGPIQRENTALAYDSVREETVLFGGWTQDGGEIRIVNDTWTWDGAAWEQKQVQGPPARVLAMFRPATGEWLIKGMNPIVFGKPGVISLCRGN